MSKTSKIEFYIYVILYTLITLSLTSCSKDDNLMSQKEIVELTAKYTETLKEITACKERIAALEEDLAATPPESAYIIEEMIEREKIKLQELEADRNELEKKLGLSQQTIPT